MPEVEPVGNDSTKGIVIGVVIAVIAVLMIIAGAVLSRKKDPEENRKFTALAPVRLKEAMEANDIQIPAQYQ